MNENTKAIIKVHIILIICFIISAAGVALYNEDIAKLYASIAITIIPLSAIIMIFIKAYIDNKEDSDAE